MWVLPVPEGPSAMTFSRRSIHSQRANSSTCILFRAGIALKSKLSRLLTAGNFAALILRSIILRSRSIISSSIRRARNCTWSSPSAAACLASLLYSRRTVGSRSDLRRWSRRIWGASLMLPAPASSGTYNWPPTSCRHWPLADTDRHPDPAWAAASRPGTARGV